MLAKDASAKDIYELKRRLKEQQKQRILERDVKQVIDIVNKHSNETDGGLCKGLLFFFVRQSLRRRFNAFNQNPSV